VTDVCLQVAKFRGRVLETLCYKTLSGSEFWPARRMHAAMLEEDGGSQIIKTFLVRPPSAFKSYQLTESTESRMEMLPLPWPGRGALELGHKPQRAFLQDNFQCLPIAMVGLEKNGRVWRTFRPRDRRSFSTLPRRNRGETQAHTQARPQIPSLVNHRGSSPV